MSPFLILAKVPTSRTGVLPDLLLRAIGPTAGLWKPKLLVSPIKAQVYHTSNESVNQMGKVLSSLMATANVDFPNTSLGKMCTCKKRQQQQAPLMRTPPKKKRFSQQLG